MTTGLYKKGMVLGVIILFVGVSVAPNITGNIEQMSERSSSSIEEIAEDNIDLNDNGNNYGTLDITSNLKGYWSFDDDITDGYVSDSSGNGKTGTIYGNPTKEVHQDYGDALEFDGDGDYIEFGGDPHFDITGDITIALWFKTDTTQCGVLVNKLDQADPDNGYCLIMSNYAWSPAGTISFKLASNSNGGLGSYDIFTTSSTFADNQWHHLAAIYTPDGTSRPKIYIDGYEQPGSPYGQALSSIGTSPGYSFRISSYSTGTGTYFFNGLIDEVRIYDRALSPDDINELCGGGGGNYYPIADSDIKQRHPSTNSGSDSTMLVSNRGGGSSDWEADTLIRFDLSSISSSTTITSASLKVYYGGYHDTNPAGRAISCYRISGNWNENTVTWNTRPSYTSSNPSYATVPSSYGWMTWDVTDYVQDFIAGTVSNYGFWIMDENYWGGGGIPQQLYQSKESGNSPYLVINTGDSGDEDTTWPMFHHDKEHTGRSSGTGFISSSPNLLWSHSGGTYTGAPAIGDVDDDGYSEVIIGNNGYQLYCVDAATGDEEWTFQYYIDGTYVKFNCQTPAIVDIDNDGQTEVIVGSYRSLGHAGPNTYVFCLNGLDGNLEWSYLVDGACTTSPNIYDVNGDGDLEIIICSNDGYFYCLSDNGNLEWSRYFTPNGDLSPYYTPAIADIDNNGDIEIVGTIPGFGTGYVCLDGWAGNIEWIHETNGGSHSSPVIANLDSDPTLEIVVAKEYGYVCLSGSDGSLEWIFDCDTNSNSVPPSIGDVDNDGVIEIIFKDNRNHILYCLDGSNGEKEWENQLAGTGGASATCVICDIDGDNNLEIIAGSRGNLLYCFDGYGNLEWTYNTGGPAPRTPSVGDVDNDGFLDIVVACYDSSTSSWVTHCLSGGNQAPSDQIIKVISVAEYDKDNKNLDVQAWVYDTLAGENVDTGTGLWEIYSDDDTSTGFTGTLSYNPLNGYWEALDINLNSLEIGYYWVKIIITSDGNSGLSAAFFTVFTGYSQLRGVAKDFNGNPISDVQISIYRLTPPFWYNHEGFTTTDINGYYSFDNCYSGLYCINAYHPDYGNFLKFLIIPSDSIVYQDFYMTSETNSDILMLLNDLYRECDDTMNREADMMGEITGEAPNALGSDYSTNDAVMDTISFIGDVVNPSTVTSTVRIGGRAVGITIAKGLFKAFIKGASRDVFAKFIAKKIIEHGLEGIIYLIAQENLPNADDYKNDPYFQFMSENLDNSYEESIANIEVITPPSEFSHNRTQTTINYVINQLREIESGFDNNDVILVPIYQDADQPWRYLTFPGSYETFMDTVDLINNIGLGKNILCVIKTGAGIAAVGLAGSIIGAPFAPIAAGISTAAGYSELGLVGAEAAARLNGAMQIMTSHINWIMDMGTLPSIYSDTGSFIEKELESPFYLDADNIFDASLEYISVKPDQEIFGVKLIVVKSFMSMEEANVGVKNIGNTDSLIRVSFNDGGYICDTVPQDILRPWDDVPFIATRLPYELLFVTGTATAVSGGAYLNLIGAVFGLSDILIPKFLRADVYTGANPVPVSSGVDYYHTIPWRLPIMGNDNEREDIQVKTSTFSGGLSLEEYVMLLANASKVYEGNLSIENHVIETGYTASENLSSVEFQLFYPNGADIDLHIFSEDEKHVGFNDISGMNSVGFPSVYSGCDSNPERIFIPGCTNKTFTIKLQLNKAYSIEESYQVILYAIETPFRPPMLSIFPEEITQEAYKDTNVSIPVFFGESGGQHPIFDVNVSISDIEYNSISLPLLSSNNIDFGIILAGNISKTSFLLDIPSSIPSGEYTGMIYVNSSNAGNISINVKIIVNNPPNIPSKPSGPTIGIINSNYVYSTSTTDPENDQVYYMFDWDDDSVIEWIGPYDSGEICIANHSWDRGGDRNIKVIAKDMWDHESDWSELLQVTISEGGDPPLVQLLYPTGGEILSGTTTVRWYAHDSNDGDNLPIHLFYSDGETWVRINDVLENTGEYDWDTTELPDGSYELLVEAIDSNGNIGHDSSEPFEIDNHYEPENEPPNKPNKPSGPTSGKTGEEYIYTSSTTDPDGDQVYYKWDWGDETSGWDGPYDSGDTVTASHIWDEKGDYNIKVKAKDVHNEESLWSDPLPISMPKNKAINPFILFLEKLIERFPILEQILQPIYDKLAGL